MPEDQKVPVTDAPEDITPATSVNEGTEPSEDGGEPADSQFDMDAFRRDLQGATQEAVSRAEFESVKRQAGQTRALQREVETLRRELQERPSDSVSRQEYDLLVEILADNLPADRLEVLNRNKAVRTAESTIKEQLTASEKRILERLGVKDEATADADPDAIDPAVLGAALNRAWEVAADRVNQYASSRGVTLTQEDFDTVQAAVPQARPDLAAERLAKVIDERAGKPAAATPGTARENRVEERKAAASGGDTANVVKDGSQGKYDMSTISGLAQARRDGVLTSAQFLEKYTALNREAGR